MGNVESGYEHGQLAAEMAVKIINGKKANDIKIVTASEGTVLVNQKTAENLGLDRKSYKKFADKIVE